MARQEGALPMTGLGGLNRSPEGVVLGLVQLQLPVVASKGDLAAQTERISAMVTKVKRGMPTLDLVVFPEYSLHGLSMDTNPDIMCPAGTYRPWADLLRRTFAVDALECPKCKGAHEAAG